MSFALKNLVGALAGAFLVSSAAYAAGLGKLTVQSALGQPLRAEIELTAVAADEAAGITAKLASPEAFRLANIEFNPALLALRFQVDARNGKQIIRISSSQPINEPFVDMLLELSWNGGRIVREYTFLLDPAELRQAQSAQAAAPVAVQSIGDKLAPKAAPAEARKPEAAKPAGASEYKVKAGDTLYKIAAQLKPREVSLDTMLVALYRANPDAFLGNNMNRLKSGQVLAVPGSDSLAQSNEGEAHAMVLAHAADFRAYSGRLAGQVAAATPAKAPEEAQSGSGKVSTKVEEKPTAANTAKDQLKLSKASATGATAGKGGSAEDTLAREQELKDAKARIKELEKNVGDLEKMLTVKGQPLPEPKPEAKPEVKPEVKPEPPKPVAKPKPPVKKLPPPPPPPTLLDTLMDNIQLLGGALGALLLGALYIVMKRRKAAAPEPAPVEPSVLKDPGTQAPEMFAEQGGQSVDTNNSVFNSSFAPSASQLDTNEVDPVAEADVYIAYGRDAQAEEILKEALRTHPERLPVRLKLLEIYANRKDTRAFEGQAKELHSYTNGEGDEWQQAAALGLSIDPLNPLYQTAAAAPAPAPAANPEADMLAAALEQAMAAPMDLELPSEAPTPAPTPAPTEAPGIDPNALDFDLGDIDFKNHGKPNSGAPVPAPAPSAPVDDMLADLSFDEAPTAVATEAPTPAPLPDLGMDLDMGLDLDLGSSPAPAPAPAAASSAAADLEALDLDSLGLDDLDLGGSAPSPAPSAAPSSDLDLAALAAEFDLPATPAPTPAPAAAVPDALAALDAMDFDLPASPAPAPAPAAEEDPLADLSLDDLDLVSPAPSAAPTAAPSLADFDLSSIDLDLPAPAAEAPAPAAPAADEDDALLSPEHQEMETKLDLAVAYQEIGDKEGARELIDEVIKGGSPRQIQRAQEMLALLG
ncbi:FimV/HubP family polar landmark protein [Massilia sp. TS11]|uniref:FimV/HubP family polar landmark protein n=1 Tax=Massilia sp. TS11 TaxID=2908003 RepID=UPI0022AAA672|nr:FimV/HubP family polar landmark protein [Massilia sp. TS11]